MQRAKPSREHNATRQQQLGSRSDLQPGRRLLRTFVNTVLWQKSTASSSMFANAPGAAQPADFAGCRG